MDLDVTNRLFLELSQFATAIPRKELVLSEALKKAVADLGKVMEAIEAAGASVQLTHALCEASAARDNARDALRKLNYI